MNTEDLKKKAVTSSAWFATTRLWMQAMSWVVTLILARILTPEDYGLFAMALAVTALLELFQEFGLGTAIIQRQNLSPAQVNGIFWIVNGGSFVFAGAAFALAGVAAWYYREPRLLWMVRLLSMIFLINSFGTVPYSLLTKEIDFKKRSLAEAYGVVVSVVVTLALAYAGYGVWSLLVGHLLRAGIRNLAMAVYCRWRPTLKVSYEGIGDLLRFSLHVAGASLVARAPTFTNPLIIGRILGGAGLGIYTMADSLGANPFQKLTTQVINQLSLPVFSKLQQEMEDLRKSFLAITRYLALIAFPLQVGMALVAADLVTVLLTPKWASTIELVRVFSIGGLFYVLPLPSSPLLTARGRADVNFRYSCLYALVMVGAIYAGALYGLRGIAIAWFASTAILRTYLLMLSLREIEIPIKKYMDTILPFAMSSIIMSLFVILVQRIRATSLINLVGSVSAGVIVYSVSILFMDKKTSKEIISLCKDFILGIGRKREDGNIV